MPFNPLETARLINGDYQRKQSLHSDEAAAQLLHDLDHQFKPLTADQRGQVLNQLHTIIKDQPGGAAEEKEIVDQLKKLGFPDTGFSNDADSVPLRRRDMYGNSGPEGNQTSPAERIAQPDGTDKSSVAEKSAELAMSDLATIILKQIDDVLNKKGPLSEADLKMLTNCATSGLLSNDNLTQFDKALHKRIDSASGIGNVGESQALLTVLKTTEDARKTHNYRE